MTEAWRKVNALEQVMLEDYFPLPNKPDIITVCFSLTRNVNIDWVHATVLPRLLSHPRFSSRLSRNRRGVFQFSPVPNFTTDFAQDSYHLQLEAPIPKCETREHQIRLFTSALSDIISTPLDTDRPLWKAHLFPAWSMNGGEDSCSIVLRVHHSLSDGIGLVKYFLATVADPDALNNPARLLVPTRRARGKDFVAGRSCLSRVKQFVGDFAAIFVMPIFREPVSVLTRAPVKEKNLCAMYSGKEIDVAILKKAARRLRVTINDVLFAAFVGAVHEYLKYSGDAPERLKGMRVAMPFNKHVFEEFDMSDLSNQLLMIPLEMPAEIENKIERFVECVDRMKRVKQGHQALFAGIAMKQLMILPAWIRRKLWHRLGSSASVLFSNVAGPKEVLRIGGIEVSEVYFFPPPDVHVAVDFGAFSYGGKVFLTAVGDAERLREPTKFLELVVNEVEGLLEMQGVIGEE